MKRMHIVLALVGLVVASASAAAQTYPSKPIKFVVPFTAGSATDTLARVVAQKLDECRSAGLS